MAPALKLWIGLALGGIALLSVATLPPSVADVTMLPPRLPEEVRASALSAQAAHVDRLIRRMRWMDSLPGLAMATQEDGLAVGGDPRLVDHGQLELIRSALKAELSTVPQTDARVVVGFFVQHVGFAGETDRFLDGRSRYEVYAGRHDGAPYCLILQPRMARLRTSSLGVWHDLEGGVHGDLLRTCRFVAAYGLPGTEIRTWLAEGGYQYSVWGPRNAGEHAGSGRRDGYGRRTFPVDRPGLTPERCVAGEADACEQLLLHDTEDRLDASSVTFEVADFPLSLGAARMGSGSPILTDAAHYLLSDLEHEYGPEAFRTFWTSDRNVPEAFEDAFGTSLGTWTVGWVATHLRLERYGPALPRGGWLATVALLLLCTLAGGVWHRRRAVA